MVVRFPFETERCIRGIVWGAVAQHERQARTFCVPALATLAYPSSHTCMCPHITYLETDEVNISCHDDQTVHVVVIYGLPDFKQTPNAPQHLQQEDRADYPSDMPVKGNLGEVRPGRDKLRTPQGTTWHHMS